MSFQVAALSIGIGILVGLFTKTPEKAEAITNLFKKVYMPKPNCF